MGLISKIESTYYCGCVTYTEETQCKKHGLSIVAQGSVSRTGMKTHIKNKKLKVIKTSKFTRFLKYAKTGYDFIILNNFKMNSEWADIFKALVFISKPDVIFAVSCDEGQELDVIEFLQPILPPLVKGISTISKTDTCSGSTFSYKASSLFFSSRTISNISKAEYIGTENSWVRHWLEKFNVKQMLEFNANTPKVSYSAIEAGVRCFIHTSHRSVYKAIVSEDYRLIMSENGVRPDGDGLFSDDKNKNSRETQIQSTKVLAKKKS